MQSKATTVQQYLAQLPPDRREALNTVRKVILANLGKDYQETMQYGMIGYSVPHSVFPDGYHCDPKQPLPFGGMASQKGHMSLYLMCLYLEGPMSEWFKKEWAKTGKKLDMGKACIRFKSVDDLALDLIGEVIRRVPAAKYIEIYQKIRAAQESRPTRGKPPAKAAKPRTKKPAAKRNASRRTVKAR
jgi:uncharacterized protein YdhG (YjbR/CyaY superfamily)